MFLFNSEERKYNYMENVLQDINRQHIALQEEEERRNNIILKEILSMILRKMFDQSPLLEKMFRHVYYGGSYYDNLKVGKPNEYDLDLLLKIPKYANPTITTTDLPGFVKVHLENYENFLKNMFAAEFPLLAAKVLDEYNYLSTGKVKQWMQSIIAKAITSFPSLSERYPQIKLISTSLGNFAFKIVESGPAFTIKLKGPVDHTHTDVEIDIDLVPCFVFRDDNWPGPPYRPNPVSTTREFFVVPKRPRTGAYSNLWRLSFQQQEGILIHGLERLKPALRLIKTLRDGYSDRSIASYYLKTIFLWEVENNKALFKKSLSYVFMTMLKKYQEYMERGEIPYYWNSYNNLIDNVNSYEARNLANRLRNIISDIERYSGDSQRVLRYFRVCEIRAESANEWSYIEDLRLLRQPPSSRALL